MPLSKSTYIVTRHTSAHIQTVSFNNFVTMKKSRQNQDGGWRPYSLC
jgi:hypothetical protein